jgi:hypothetical protein
VSEEDGGFGLPAGRQRGCKVLDTPEVLIDACDGQGASGGGDGDGLVSQESDRRAVGGRHSRVIVVSQDGIDRGALGERLEEPAHQLGRLRPFSRRIDEVPGCAEQIVIGRAQQLLGVVQDAVPASEVEIRDMGDAQPGELGREAAYGNGQVVDDDGWLPQSRTVS